ncbi:MAG: hypothetical protein ACOYT4_03680 [Nanoarchaeota archaeon]
MKEAENVLRILKETEQAIKQNDSYKLNNLSNQTIHSATISQDTDNIIVAVLVYALSKIIERENYKSMEGWDKFYLDLLKNLDLSIKYLEKKNLDDFRDRIGEIRNSINNISSDLREYIKDVFRKAEINKAFKIYEHGLSFAQTAELLGISLWDLSSYIGQTNISEAKIAQSMPEKERIKIAEEIFS